MLSVGQDLLILIATVGGSMLFIVLLNRLWPQERRSVNNDLIGWQLTLVGTTYAVVLGFMLFAVWSAFGEAQLNVDMEANALRNIYHMANPLPEPQRTQLKQDAREYAEVVLDQDWAQMGRGEVPEGSHAVDQAMWKTAMSIKVDSPTTAAYTDHFLSQLAMLSQHRRTRMLQTVAKLPALLWIVLIVGAVVTILSAATFGPRSSMLHAFQVGSFTLLVTLVLLAIGDINLPFQGWIHISNDAFVRAQTYMKD